MQRIILFLTILFSINCFSQGLTVDTASPQDLSNTIVNTNCVTTSNWIVTSGSNYGEANSVGTFVRPTSATFPLSRGIVLSTGSLTNIPGPKVLPFISPSVPNPAYSLGDGNNPLWIGDAAMNTFLGATNFTNASSLEFDFVSQKNTFSLNYVFASEEYGQRQCNGFSDVMVILLTDLVSGVTVPVNIAQTPTTNLIISPNTIRNSTYNGGCSSENSQLFDNYYGVDTVAPNAPINLFGNTIEMTAQANIIPNNPYKIKIVVADRFDYQFDSAVFIKSFSPTIQNGTFLGPNVQLCEGTPHQISTGTQYTSAQYDFSWRKDGNLISLSNTNTINASSLTGTSVYSVSVTPKAGFCDVNDGYQDSVIIEYIPQQNTPDPITLNKCIGSTDPYDLSQNTQIISAGLSYTPTITYHASSTNATSGASPLPLDYNGSLTTLWVRIVQPGSPCPPLVKQFNLGTTTGPQNMRTPDPVVLCALTSSSSNSRINFNPITTFILNGQSPIIYGVTYHTSQTGANNNTNLINVLGNGNALVVTSTIYARIYVIGSQNCFTTVSFSVTVNPRATAFKPDPVVYCGPTYILPVLPNGNKYFENPYDGMDATSQLLEIPAGTPITIPTGFVGTYHHPTIYVSNLLTDTNSCSEEWPLDITLIQPSSFTETDKTECDDYTLPVLEYGDYWTGPNGTGTKIDGGTTLTTSTQIHYYFQSTINEAPNLACNVPAGPVTITIENSPDLGPDRPNVFTCEPPYILPNLSATYPGAQYFNNPNGTGTPIPEGSAINSTQTVYAYLADTTGTLGCASKDAIKIIVGLDPITVPPSCNYVLPVPDIGEYWDGPHAADGSCNGCTQLFPGDYIEASGTYYLYVSPPPGETCTTGQNQVSFTVTVTQPTVDSIPGFTTPHCGEFILPNITNGRYFTTSQLGGLGDPATEVFAGFVVSTNQTIYVYNSNVGSNPLCDFEKSFDFIINPKPALDSNIPDFIDNCNITSYPLTLPSSGNYYTGINGTGQILNSPLPNVPNSLILNGPFPVDLFLYNKDDVTGCESQRTIRITSSQTLTDVHSPNIEEWCTSYTLPPLSNNGSRYHDYYWNPSEPNDPQNVSTVAPTPLTNLNITIPTSQPNQNFYDKTFYIYNSTLDGIREICSVNNPFRVVVYRQPNIIQPDNIYTCDGLPVTLPTLPAGQKYYNESHISGGATTFTEITTPITSSQTVYVYESVNSIVTGSTFKCEDEKSFTVNIFSVDTGSNISGCGEITLPALTNGNYYDDPNGVNPITNLTFQNTGTTIITNRIYIYAPSGFPPGQCLFAENFFDITINPIPSTNPIPLYDADPLIIDRTYCDTDDSNDGILDIGLTQYSPIILGTQANTEYNVTYHGSLSDAENNLNPITSSLSNNTAIYAVVRYNDPIFECGSLPYKLEFVINKLPEPIVENKYVCINNITGLPINLATLDSGLNASDYTFQWTDSSGAPVGTSSAYSTNISGQYTVVATDRDITKGCVSSPVTASIIESSIAIGGYTISQDFSDEQVVTVIVLEGLGTNYIYQLDNGLFQDSNVFINVPSGLHDFVIRDKNGCGDSDPIKVLIINYPKFFTPNNDGFNDNWNIFDLQELNDPKAKISIFDRTGKLLKQISPFGEGWDGLYNSKPLPSDDYWFTVTYIREGINREFKSHFTLKR